VELELFNLTFEAPIESFEGNVINLGSAIAARSGVWTFEARDPNGRELSAKEMGLSRSSHLNSAFAYVADSDPNGIMELPNLAFKRSISNLQIGYAPIYTKTPIQSEQFGPLVFLVNEGTSHRQVPKKINLAWGVGSAA
jgi:hypothetical protein